MAVHLFALRKLFSRPLKDTFQELKKTELLAASVSEGLGNVILVISTHEQDDCCYLE